MADYKLQFTAVIEKQGPNPYVDVPDLPAAVVARFGNGGRVRVRGTLNGAPVQASLVPVGKQGRRLYVNGGMRAAAKVDVGDTVAFDLEPMPYDEVVVADDVAAGLLEAGANAPLSALPPSHRREWIGFIDDARTPETRAKRIRQTAAELLGIPATPARPERDRPLWTCPECGNEFVNPNQYHSCAKHSVETPFQGKPAHVQASFDRLRAMVEQCGPVKLVPYANRVGFMVRVRFAAAVPKTRWLDVGFWLRKRVESPRFRRVQTISPDVHVHLLRVTRPEDLDDEVMGWVRESYRVGAQERGQPPVGAV